MKTIHLLFNPWRAQVRNGQKGRALGFQTIFIALCVVAASTTWLHTAAGLVSFVGLLVMGYLIALWDADRRGGTPAVLSRLEAAFLTVPTLLILVAIVVPGLRRDLFGLELFRIPMRSNVPVLQPGDRIVAEMDPDLVPERGMMVLFKGPRTNGRTFVKRVVALAGETVEGGEFGIHVNGESISRVAVEPFGPVTVARGHVFVLGDNVANSRDSRQLGAIPIPSIVGAALYVLWAEAWDRIGRSVR